MASHSSGGYGSLEGSISDAGQIQSEFGRVQSLLADEQSSSRRKEQVIQMLEEKRRILMEQTKGSSSQLKDLQQQKEKGELDISNLQATLQRLQQNWQLMELEEMREEFTDLLRDLRLRIKDLESQVELQQEEAARLVKHQATRNPLSIADEVELQVSSAAVDLRLRIKDLESQVELQQEEAARLVKHQATRNPLSIADEVELQVSSAAVV
ncbi:hypothetical protein NHX12_011934, partial [Muraenolepis orangiensis]